MARLLRYKAQDGGVSLYLSKGVDALRMNAAMLHRTSYAEIQSEDDMRLLLI